MSSQPPFSRSNTSSSFAPPPYSPIDVAGSSRSTPAYRGDNRAIIEPSFSSPLHVRPDSDASRQQDRTNLMNMDRKRRLTSTANDEAAPSRRPSALSEPSSLSRNNRLQQDRPLPMLPVGDDRNHYVRPGVPGSSRENAIDLTSSTSVPNISRQHSRSLSTVPQHSRPDIVEYTLPRWQPDSEVTQCTICGSHFSFWYRKHHCRKCGRVVCAACSPHRITIPRQYIVRPPKSVDQLASETLSCHSRGSSREPDSPVSETFDTATTFITTRPDTNRINPALGGGEEVRLCNPCVPDPNPDPPLTYGAVRSSFDRLPDPNWGATMPAVPISQRFHQVRRSLSGVQIFSPRRDIERETQDNYRRHQTVGYALLLIRKGEQTTLTSY